jgi:hypothetical protein
MFGYHGSLVSYVRALYLLSEIGRGNREFHVLDALM